jgi:hypothetical protein
VQGPVAHASGHVGVNAVDVEEKLKMEFSKFSDQVCKKFK